MNIRLCDIYTRVSRYLITVLHWKQVRSKVNGTPRRSSRHIQNNDVIQIDILFDVIPFCSCDALEPMPWYFTSISVKTDVTNTGYTPANRRLGPRSLF